MKKYARIYNGSVVELFETDGDITQMFHPDFIWVDITDLAEPPDERWNAIEVDGVWSFTPYVPPLPTAEEILASQSAKLVVLKSEAESQKVALTNRISTLQDAIDNVGIDGMEEFAATPEEQAEFPKRKTQLTKWKNYAILLGRVTSQAGWPPDVVWPTPPAEGMDLTVSSFSHETI